MRELMITLDNASEKHLYEQIYEHIRDEIRVGKLRRGEQLPSTRLLAAQLLASRTTVEQAYEQLAAEGYIEARPYRGFFVCDIGQMPQIAAAASAIGKDDEKKNDRESKDRMKKSLKYDFSPNGMDLSHFPFDTWKRIHKQVLLDEQEKILLLGDAQGDYKLRETISRYLHSYRGVNCTPERIVVGAGNDYLLLLLQKILGEKKRIAMENATYMRAYQIFRHGGYEVKPVGTDKSGLCMEDLDRADADIVYTMPAHQFPLGITMPISRRLELLEWAKQKENRYVIEDDYDSEFRYRAKPIPALQSYDDSGKVIYIGTFSKSIAPAIRISYLVLPQGLLGRYEEYGSFLSSTVPRIDQAVLCAFIAGGHFERYLNKTRKLYHEKRDRMIELLMPFRAAFEISGDAAGLHMVLKAKKNGKIRQEIILIEKATEQDCAVSGLSEYQIEKKPEGAVLLGYGALAEEEMKEAISALKRAWL